MKGYRPNRSANKKQSIKKVDGLKSFVEDVLSDYGVEYDDIIDDGDFITVEFGLNNPLWNAPGTENDIREDMCNRGCWCEFSVRAIQVGIEDLNRWMDKSVRKVYYGFNNSRLDAFKEAFESEWRMLCMRNEGVTHEETQLDDKNFVAIVRCPQGPLPDFEIKAFIGSLERMGFKLDFYTEPFSGDMMEYQFHAIDNQTHGYESLLDEPVEVMDGKGNHYTLREAIEEFGIKEEPENPDDARVFARCPSLNNLCGPMAPNHGYVACYESWEVYDMMSLSTRKSFNEMVKKQRCKR